MTSTHMGRLTGRRRWSTAILGLITTTMAVTGFWASTAGATAGPQMTRAAGAPDGLIRMRQGNMEMVMTRLSGKAPTWAELQRVYTMVHSAAIATAKFHTLAAAQRAGYVTAPDLLVDGQGAHYFQPGFEHHGCSVSATPKRIGKALHTIKPGSEHRCVGSEPPSSTFGGFDPMHPAFLVYNPMHGQQVLSGLMYYLPGSLTPAQLATIFPASMASWHKHINVCITGGTSLLTGKAIIPYFDPASCAAHGGTFTGDTGWMVHTWIGQANGAGLFDMDMPTSSNTPAMGNMPGM